MTRYGIWFSAVGYVAEGWLATDGNHGRGRDLDFDTEAEAEEAAKREEEHDRETAFFVAEKGSEDKVEWRKRWVAARARVRARMRGRLDDEERLDNEP
jgi:hypothetical protein